MKLSVITLTYNKLDYTKKFIESLYRYTKDFELIIVDNGSTDGTREFLKEHPEIKVIFNDENKGFSAGNNQGIEIAEGEYIGFLNNDILLSPNWFEACEEVFEKENAAFVSPRHINPAIHNTNQVKYLDFFKCLHFKNDYQKNFEECVFSCVITRKDVISKIGKFDENYIQAFFEDNDYKYRAILAGHGVYVCNKVCFFHFGSVTSKALNQYLEQNRKYYYSKYPFAEYLSVNGYERYNLLNKVKFYERFYIEKIYLVYDFWLKILRNLRRIIKK